MVYQTCEQKMVQFLFPHEGVHQIENHNHIQGINPDKSLHSLLSQNGSDRKVNQESKQNDIGPLGRC
jgi:hypothetical protein